MYTFVAVPISYVFDSYLSVDEVGTMFLSTSLYPSNVREGSAGGETINETSS